MLSNIPSRLVAHFCIANHLPTLLAERATFR